METTRQLKFGKLIQKELSEVFRKEGASFISGAFVTITNVRVSPDLSQAKIYLSLFKHKQPKVLIELLNGEAKEIRRLLGNRIKRQVRHIPELIFYHDDSLDYVEKMDNLFNQLNIPPETNKGIEE